MEISKFHFYSFGKVAANKPLGSSMVEVFPIEKFSMANGEITDNVETIAVKGKDAGGEDYQGKMETKPPLTCMWLPIGEPNRVTAPDVRRDESVIIYRFADTNYYFWTNAMNNILRKLETAAWWFSGTPTEGEGAETKRTADNGYIFEISTHEKHIILSTSNKNGEVARYYLQFNTGEGNFTLKDDLGQEVEFDSPGGKINVTSQNEVNVKTKKHTVDCEQYIVNCKTYSVNASESATFTTPITTLSKDLKVGGKSLLVGFANFTTGIGGGGSGETAAALAFKGNVTQTGTWSTTGAFSIQGAFRVTGTGSFTGNVSAPNI